MSRLPFIYPSLPPSLFLPPSLAQPPSIVREEKSAHRVCIIGEERGSALVPTHHPTTPCTSSMMGRDGEGAREDREDMLQPERSVCVCVCVCVGVQVCTPCPFSLLLNDPE